MPSTLIGTLTELAQAQAAETEKARAAYRRAAEEAHCAAALAEVAIVWSTGKPAPRHVLLMIIKK